VYCGRSAYRSRQCKRVHRIPICFVSVQITRWFSSRPRLVKFSFRHFSRLYVAFQVVLSCRPVSPGGGKPFIYLHIYSPDFRFIREIFRDLQFINSGPRPSELRSMLVNPRPLFGKWAHCCRDQIEEEEGRRLLWRRWEYNIKLKGCKRVDWIWSASG
jgi:hypothetical protein